LRDNTDSVIGASIADAIAKLPPSQYDRVMNALGRHETQVRMEPDGDHVVIFVEDLPLVRVHRLTFTQGRHSAPRN
jgi:hypothetical protein